MRKEIRKMVDANTDGIITQEEIEQAEKLQELHDKMRKSEAQERMAWVALFTILVFTAILFSPFIDVVKLSAIAEFIGMFYITLAGIIAAYMGTQAWVLRK